VFVKVLRYNTLLPECKSTPTAFGPNYEDCEIVFPVGMLAIVKEMECLVCYWQSSNYVLTDLQIFSCINSFGRILLDIRFVDKCKYCVIRDRIVHTFTDQPTVCMT
jgi:hypothetical protein